MIVIHGPMSSGKTFHRDALARHYRCRSVVDSWTPHHFDGPRPPKDGDLVLTYCSPAEISRHLRPKRIIGIDIARRAIGVGKAPEGGYLAKKRRVVAA